MVPRLTKTKAFLDDFDRWKNEIESIDNEAVKEKGNRMLRDLLKHAEQIDVGHNASYGGDVRPGRLRDNLHSLQTIRYKLEQFVRDLHR